MDDDLAGAGDGAAGRGVAGEDEERTLAEMETARLAEVLSAEARKGT
jgi:hypothetical protein